MPDTAVNRESLKEYYGKVLKGSADLKTSACCCTDEHLAPRVKAALANIDDEITSRFYGCGSPIPPVLEGCTVLDLGCGTGRDVYIAAQLVGASGRVIGVDMTEEQLAVARKYLDSHMQRFGYPSPNVSFRQGYMEDLKELDIADNSVDVVISNCVLNLSPDKPSVFSEIFRVLKPGGELFFSDVFSGRRVPENLRADPLLHGECLSGAMYREDFRRLLRTTGFMDYRIMSSRRIELNSSEMEGKIGLIDFFSETIRAFKLEGLEDRCEDYGQVVIYKGSIRDWPNFFVLDNRHRFTTGKPQLVCGNTALMLSRTRLGCHFKLIGDHSLHFGPFECSGFSADITDMSSSKATCC